MGPGRRTTARIRLQNLWRKRVICFVWKMTPALDPKQKNPDFHWQNWEILAKTSIFEVPRSRRIDPYQNFQIWTYSDPFRPPFSFFWPKRSPDDPQMIPRWSPNGPRWPPNDPQMIPRWRPNDPNMTPKSSPDDVQMMPNWSLIDDWWLTDDWWLMTDNWWFMMIVLWWLKIEHWW